MRKIAIVISIIAGAFPLVGCFPQAITVTVTPPVEAYPVVSAVPATTVAPAIAVAKNTPTYNTVNFHLGDNDQHVFPIYLTDIQTLHLFWLTRSNDSQEHKVWFHVITPSGKGFGFYHEQQRGQFLKEGFCQEDSGGMTISKPSDLNDGEGYYQCLINSSSACDVEVQYWIE